MSIEFEIKLALPLRIRTARVERAFAEVSGISLGEWSDHLQENTYFDSSDGAIRRARIALRHRMVDGRHVLTVKTAGEGGARHEWEREFDGGSLAEALRGLAIETPLPPIEALIRGETEPVAIAGTDYVRRKCIARYRGSEIELAIDRGELSRPGVTRRFAELELELLEGSEEDVRDLAETVRRALALRYETHGKLARALGSK